MSTTPKEFINLVRFTTGRRIFTARQVRAVAVALNLPELVAHGCAARQRIKHGLHLAKLIWE